MPKREDLRKLRLLGLGASLVGLGAATDWLSRRTARLAEVERGARAAVGCTTGDAAKCAGHRPPVAVFAVQDHLEDLIKFARKAIAELEGDRLDDRVYESVCGSAESVVTALRWIYAHYGRDDR